MGMHHGILVSTTGLEATVAALDARMPKLRMGSERGSLDTMDLEPTDEGWRLAGGELDGRTYLLDTTMLLSSDGDVIVDVSRELGCLVVGCGQETVSGTFWLYAADNGRLLRAYWNSYGDMEAAWSKGDPFESEELEPIEDLDGQGLIAVLASLGFDYERWAAGTDLLELTYDIGEDEVPSGPLAAELEAFRASVEIPRGKQPKPKVVRRDGGFDLATPRRGSDGGGGLMGFVRRLLGGGGSSARTPLPGQSPAPPDGPAARAAPVSRTSSGVSRPAPLQAPPRQPKRPSIADMPPGRKQFYLEYVGGNSSKFYAVSLEEEDGGTWRVRFTFGRIGFPRAWDTRVEGATWARASTAYMSLIDEKMGKGYEPRPWPASLNLPDGATLADDAAGGDAVMEQTLFRAAKRGTLPPETGGSIAGIALPDGTLYAAEAQGGSRGEEPVIWASDEPVRDVGQRWARLAMAFPETGVWPFVIDSDGFEGFGDYLMDVPRGRHTEVVTILRRNWGNSIGLDDDDEALESVAPFGRQFPGLADRTPGERASSIDSIVASLEGHLGLVAVNRPADALDAVGWMGATNFDFDPLDMSTVLRSWEVRFDAYLVGLGTDTLSLAVGRPALDLDAALAIAAEHYAFCPDNVDQGVGTISEYAPMLVGLARWDFWWD